MSNSNHYKIFLTIFLYSLFVLLFIFPPVEYSKIGKYIYIDFGSPETKVASSSSSSNSEVLDDTGSPYLIQKETCTIFKTNMTPRDPETLKKFPNCSYEEMLSTVDDDLQILSLLSKYKNKACCLHTLERQPGDDNTYKLSDCQKIKGYVDVSEKEMFITRCGNNLNFEANLKVTPQIQKKIGKWNNVKKDKRPISVMMIGVDSVSRAEAYRSWPKTMDQLRTMGFVDFKGYHSAESGTIHNFLAFLLGLSIPNVRKTCAPDWKTPFDSCPFIWKNYSDNGYVTMYIEDSHQSFNWAEQSGFKWEKPTDYYIHALFNALQRIRASETLHKVLKLDAAWASDLDNYSPCFSKESAPEFVFRYTRRFIRKFQDVPTFSFSFFADPFHNHVDRILPKYDSNFLEFFQYLDSNTICLNDTLIVFLSDHGYRTRDIDVSSDRFVEMGLPMFFIRIPKKLVARFPNAKLRTSLQINAESLTSPYDLHQTFLHILHLNQEHANFEPEKFTSFRPSISSLFLPVDEHRSCADIWVLPRNCVCNVIRKPEKVKDAAFLKKMLTFALKKLNDLINSSKYSHVCEKWESTESYSALVFAATPKYKDILLRLKVNPGGAKFEVRIRAPADDTQELSLVGESDKFLRTNTYGNQSWCVNSVTDSDKELKGLCMCK